MFSERQCRELRPNRNRRSKRFSHNQVGRSALAAPVLETPPWTAFSVFLHCVSPDGESRGRPSAAWDYTANSRGPTRPNGLIAALTLRKFCGIHGPIPATWSWRHPACLSRTLTELRVPRDCCWLVRTLPRRAARARGSRRFATQPGPDTREHRWPDSHRPADRGGRQTGTRAAWGDSHYDSWNLTNEPVSQAGRTPVVLNEGPDSGSRAYSTDRPGRRGRRCTALRANNCFRTDRTPILHIPSAEPCSRACCRRYNARSGPRPGWQHCRGLRLRCHG